MAWSNDGTSGRYLAPASPWVAAGTNPYTFMAWVRFASNTGYQNVYYYAGGDSLQTENGAIGYWNANSVQTNFHNFTLNEWFHVAVVKNGTAEVRLFLNGVFQTNVTTGLNGGTAGNTCLMAWDQSSDYPNGQLAYTKIWAAALTDAEVYQEYAAAFPQRRTNLWGFFPAFSGTTEKVSNYGGTGGNLTETGTLLQADNPPTRWGRSQSGLIIPQQVPAQYAHTPVVTSLGTVGPADNLSPDGVTWAQAPPIHVDQYGNIIYQLQDNSGNKDIDFLYSNDGGTTWNTTALNEGFLLRGSMVLANGYAHVLYAAQGATDGVIYRRYSIAYDGSNNITGFTEDTNINLQLDFNIGGGYEHPVLLYCPDIGANGSLVAIWSARDTDGGELRASMRQLSLDANDNTAANWTYVTSNDTSTISTSPAVPYSILSSVSSANALRTAYASAIRLSSGSNANDLFIFYAEDNGSSDWSYKFRRAQWNSGTSNWSTGLTAPTTVTNITRSGTDTGYDNKYQTVSQLAEDTLNSRVYVSFSTFKDDIAEDTWTFCYIDSSDVVSSLVDVYEAGNGNSASNNFVTGDIIYDNELKVAFVSYTDLPNHYIYLQAFDGTTQVQGETLVENTFVADIPTMYNGRYADGGTDKILMLTRDFNGTDPGAWTPPYQGYYIELSLDEPALTTVSRTITPVNVATIETVERFVPATIATLNADAERNVPATVVTSLENYALRVYSVALEAPDAGVTTVERTVGASIATIDADIERTVPSSVAVVDGITRTVTPVSIRAQQVDLERSVSGSVDVLAEEERTVSASARLRKVNLSRTVPSTVVTSVTLERTVGSSVHAQAENERIVSSSVFASTTQDPHQIYIGEGYSDVSMQQLVRTTGNVLYVMATECDEYPQCSADGLSQTLRAYGGNAPGTPASFTRYDSGSEPTGVFSWSSAIDSSDVIHTVYAHRLAGGERRLSYVTFNTATNTWGTPETVTANIDSTDIGQGDEMVAMHLDANGVPHVVYLDHDGTRRNAYYKNRIGGTWGSLLQVDSDITYGNNFKAWHPSIAFFPNGSLLAAWMSNDFNEGNAGIIYTRFRSTEGVWLSSVQVGNADHHGGIDSGVSLVITSDSVVHLSSTGAKNAQGEGQVRYYYSSNNGATWSANHWSGHGTHNVGVGPVGNSNRIRLFFHGPEDPNNDSIYVLTGGGATAWAGTATLYTSGGFDSSVSTRWAQFHHAYPSTTDVVYWDHIYPNIAYAGTDVAKERSVPSSVLTTSQDISIIVPAEVAALKENERNVTTAVKTAQFIERTVPSSVATLSGDLERNVTASIDVLAEEERTVPSVVRIQQTDIERSVASAIDTQQTLERTVGASIATLEERERSLGASIVTISDSLDRTVPASIAVIDTQERTVSSTIEVVEENIERSVGASVATLEERERAVSASVVSNLESGREVPASIVVIAIDVERTVPAQVRGSTTEERTVPAGVFAGVENERYIPSTVITSFANIPIVIRLEEAELVVRFEIEEFSGA